MRNRTLISLASALFVSLVASAAVAQVPYGQEQPAQPQPPQPQSPIPGVPLPPIPPQLQQVLPLPGQPAQPPASPPPTPGYPAPPGYGTPPGYAPAPGYGTPPGYAPAPGYGTQPGYPPAPGYGTQPGYAPAPGYGYSPGYGPTMRSGLEIGFLYGAAIAYGVGAGIWIDAEATPAGNSVDPGLSLIAPLLLGAGMPMAVYIADRRPMPEGLPSAIASGLVLGASEGLLVAAFGSARGSWDFRALSRAEVIGATLGGAGGVAYGLLARPTPKRNMFITSSAVWGSLIGFEFGGGATSGPGGWDAANDGVTLGGLLGFNLALAGAAGASAYWTPSWNQLGMMWAGFGIGEVASTLVYPFYAASKSDARHGLIFQGIAGGVGVVAGAFIGRPDNHATLAREQREEREWMKHPHVARLRGGGLMPVQGGAGAMVMGELW